MSENTIATITPEAGLAPVPFVGPTPREVVEGATDQAEVLMDIVEQRKLYYPISGKKYLEYDAWAVIGAFNNAHPITDWVKLLEDGDGYPVGYNARVSILKNGEIIASAEMPCGFDDFPCRGKSGTAAHKAAMSAAQTWAASKAYRMKFSWVSVLAGFEATTADEMRGPGEDAKPHNQTPQKPTSSPQPPKTDDAYNEFRSTVKKRWPGISLAQLKRALDVDDISQILVQHSDYDAAVDAIADHIATRAQAEADARAVEPEDMPDKLGALL